MTESEREALIDKRVMRRLATDSAYRNAANADEQAQREDEIAHEETMKLAGYTYNEPHCGAGLRDY